jgi:hypothetical protein
MPSDLITKIIDYSFELVSEANLSIGFMEGTGLGAILLAAVSINFIRSQFFRRMRLGHLIDVWRRKT